MNLLGVLRLKSLKARNLQNALSLPKAKVFKTEFMVGSEKYDLI